MSKLCIKYRMVELKLKQTLIRLDFSFFAVVALYLLLDESGFGLAALAACFMHETAHFIAMALCGVRADSLTLYGAGMRITSGGLERAKPFQKVVILSAGVFVNLIAAAVFWSLEEFGAAAVNLFTGLFNLLPMGELDGAQMLKMLFIRRCRAERVDGYIKLAACISAAITAGAVIFVCGEVPLTLVTTAVYIIIMCSGKI